MSEEDTAWGIRLSSGGGPLRNSSSKKLGFDQHLMDPCVFLLREPSSRQDELHDDVLVIPFGDVGPPRSLCGLVKVRVDDQINGGRGVRWEKAMKHLRCVFPFVLDVLC